MPDDRAVPPGGRAALGTLTLGRGRIRPPCEPRVKTGPVALPSPDCAIEAPPTTPRRNAIALRHVVEVGAIGGTPQHGADL